MTSVPSNTVSAKRWKFSMIGNAIRELRIAWEMKVSSHHCMKGMRADIVTEPRFRRLESVRHGSTASNNRDPEDQREPASQAGFHGWDECIVPLVHLAIDSTFEHQRVDGREDEKDEFRAEEDTVVSFHRLAPEKKDP